MKLLYGGQLQPPYETFKRMLLLGTELHFMDRPSVTFNNWGTVGHDSPFRKFSTVGEPVTISVYAPHSGPARELYRPYIESDLTNPEFIKVFIEGLRNSPTFAWKFIAPDGKYRNDLLGQEVRAKLLSDIGPSMPSLNADVDGSVMFDMTTERSRLETLKVLAMNASIEVTSTLIAASEVSALPISDDPYICRLLALRSSQSHYVGETAYLSPYLGLEFAKAVIPDELLQKIDVPDILEYRKKSKGAYDAWSAEISRISTRLNDIPADKVEREIKTIIATELIPNTLVYKNELISARELLFSDALKGIASWEVPALTIAFLTELGMAGALATFASAALRGAAPQVIDYIKSKRAINRNHAVSYLIGVAKS